MDFSAWPFRQQDLRDTAHYAELPHRGVFVLRYLR